MNKGLLIRLLIEDAIVKSGRYAKEQMANREFMESMISYFAKQKTIPLPKNGLLYGTQNIEEIPNLGTERQRQHEIEYRKNNELKPFDVDAYKKSIFT